MKTLKLMLIAIFIANTYSLEAFSLFNGKVKINHTVNIPEGMSADDLVQGGTPVVVNMNSHEAFAIDQFKKYSEDVTVVRYSGFDGSLMDLEWSLLNTKAQKAEFNNGVLVLNSSIPNAVFTATTEELKFDIENPTALTYVMAAFPSSGSTAGVIYNYDDEEGDFEAFLLDKKNYYVMRCKNGRMTIRHSGASPIKKLNSFMLRLVFADGKITYSCFDPKYQCYMELWSGKGELTSSNSGVVVIGKNTLELFNMTIIQPAINDENQGIESQE